MTSRQTSITSTKSSAGCKQPAELIELMVTLLHLL